MIFICVNNFDCRAYGNFAMASIQFIWRSFLGRVRLDDNIRHPRRTRCQARGAPLPPTRLHLSRWPAPSFRLVPGSLIRQRQGGKRRDGLDVNAAPSPPPPNPFGTRNRAIYRPPAGQPSYPIPRPKGGKSRVPRQNRVGGGGRERDRRARDGTVSRAVAERVPVINSHRPPADGPRIEFTRCIHVLERIGRLFKREWPSRGDQVSLLVTYTSPSTHSKSAEHS